MDENISKNNIIDVIDERLAELEAEEKERSTCFNCGKKMRYSIFQRAYKCGLCGAVRIKRKKGTNEA